MCGSGFVFVNMFWCIVSVEEIVFVCLIMKPYGLSVSMQAASTGSCDAGKKHRDET